MASTSASAGAPIIVQKFHPGDKVYYENNDGPSKSYPGTVTHVHKAAVHEYGIVILDDPAPAFASFSAHKGLTLKRAPDNFFRDVTHPLTVGGVNVIYLPNINSAGASVGEKRLARITSVKTRTTPKEIENAIQYTVILDNPNDYDGYYWGEDTNKHVFATDIELTSMVDEHGNAMRVSLEGPAEGNAEGGRRRRRRRTQRRRTQRRRRASKVRRRTHRR